VAIGRGDTAPAIDDAENAERGPLVPASVAPVAPETPFTPDTAPAGLSVRRRWFVPPLLLLGFAIVAAAMESSFPRMTFEYGRLIRDLAQDPQLLLPKQASIAIRPLFASLLVLFALFAAGPLRRRLRLLAMSLVLYVSITVLADVALARLSEIGGPSPFMAYGNTIAGLLGVLVVTVSVFSNALLPGDVRVDRVMPRRWLPLIALLAAAAASVACVAAIERFSGSYIHQHLSHVPLLGGSGSAIVMFFVVLPAALCLIGAIVGFFRSRPAQGKWHSVAFVVPAREEEEMIGDCVRAIAAAAAQYPGEVEAIVVENGSSDGTLAEAQAAFDEHPGMSSSLVECPPLGKSRALNVGLAQAEADIVVRIDADTLVTPELLVKVVPHFWEETVGGVGVLPVPREQRGWIAHMRAIETYYGAAFKRAAQNVADCVTVLPGATVAYRRSILLDLGGFAEGVNGEDADITVRVGRLGYRIVADWRIKTYTDTPHNLSQLREQRMRWSRGLYHMIGRNRSAIWMRQGVRGMWMLPWASFMMFRKLMLVPFAVAVIAMILVHPSTLPLREVAAAGAIVIGVQLLQMVVVMLCYGKPSLVAVLPSYLVFRLIVTYYALEALLTLAIGPAKKEPVARDEAPVLTLVPKTLSAHERSHPIPTPINQEA
jgi:cellulose synthase/poly-beta-1,6-N-acetylglucosamine synthase-like glycosyltransferase